MTIARQRQDFGPQAGDELLCRCRLCTALIAAAAAAERNRSRRASVTSAASASKRPEAA
jgi:hypothetical protein